MCLDENANLSCFHSFVLPLLEYSFQVWMSTTDSKIVQSAHFLFLSGGNYDLDHHKYISSLCLFQKCSFNEDQPLYHLDAYVLSQLSLFSDQQHQYSANDVQCQNTRFQREFIPYTANMWNTFQPVA